MVELRAATPLDGEAMGHILQDWLEETPWMPVLHTRAETIRFCDWLVAEGRVTVASSDGKVVGFMAQHGDEIDALYIRSEARKRGVGGRMLGIAKQSSAQLMLWCFQANHAALRFYRREGFGEESRTDGRDNDEKLPDIRLIWSGQGAAAE